MIRSNHILALAAAACLAPAAAHAKSYAIEPVAADDTQFVRFEQGIGAIESDGDRGDVWARPTAKAFDKRITLSIGVSNKSGRAADIDTGNIRVVTAEGDALEVLTLDKMEKEAKSKAAWAGIGVAMLGAVANAASTNTTTSSFRGPYGTQTLRVKSFNPAVAQAAADGTDMANSQIQANLGARLDELGKTALQRTTVDNGEVGGGYVTIAAPPKNATGLRVRIDFAGESHELAFNIKR